MSKIKLLFAILTTSVFLNSCSTNNEGSDESECTYTPTLTTSAVFNITSMSAAFEGKIVAPTCESTVTSQGFVFAKTTLPKIDDIIIEVNGTSISHNEINLERNTTYYVRTFFENPTGQYYGNQEEFKTLIGDIEITTKDVENITRNTAKTGGVIIDDGGAAIISSGVCWSTSANPTLDDFILENTSGDSNFNSELSELLENTTYYIRTYLTNSEGTTYGNEQVFTTPNSIYKVELSVTGNIETTCGITANYFYYEVSYKFDDNEAILEGAEGLNKITYDFHSQEGKINNNLEVIIHLANFDTSTPAQTSGGGSLNDISIVITNVSTNQEVLNTALQPLFICFDVAYKNTLNFNPIDESYTVERSTYGF